MPHLFHILFLPWWMLTVTPPTTSVARVLLGQERDRSECDHALALLTLGCSGSQGGMLSKSEMERHEGSYCSPPIVCGGVICSTRPLTEHVTRDLKNIWAKDRVCEALSTRQNVWSCRHSATLGRRRQIRRLTQWSRCVRVWRTCMMH